MESSRAWRTLWLTLAVVCFVVGVFGARNGRIYPSLPVGTAAAACCLLVGLLQNVISERIVVVAACALSSVYRLTVFLLPASLIGFDPDAYATRIQVYLSTGHQASAITGFYEIANGFTSGTAVVAQVAGLPPQTALAIWPLAGGVLLPLLAAGIARTVTPKPKVAGLAALLISFSAPTLQYSFTPVPLFASALFVGGFVFALTRRLTTGSTASLLLLFVFALGMGGTHKIPLFVTAGIVIFLAVPLYLGGRISQYPMTLSVLFGGVVLTIQWIYATVYVTEALPTILGVLLGDLSTTTPPPPTAATRYHPEFLSRLRDMVYFPTVIAVGGLSYLAVSYIALWKRRIHAVSASVLLAAVAVTTGIVLPGALFSAGPGFSRVGVFTAIFLAPLIAIALGEVAGRDDAMVGADFSGAAKMAVGVVVTAVVVAHLVSVPATPDYGDGPRFYLTEGEVAGKHWYNQHEADPVYDMYYGDEVVDFRRAAAEGGRHFRQVPHPTWSRDLVSRELLERTLLEEDYRSVAVRTDVEVYRLKGGRYRLQWSPETTLNRTYSRVYSNGQTALFERPSQNETATAN